jgi:hypothetical protein
MPRRQVAGKRFEKIVADFVTLTNGKVRSLGFMPSLAEDLVLHPIFERAGLDPACPGDWQLVAGLALKALNFKNVGRRKRWKKPALEHVIELAEEIYLTMPGAKEATVAEIIFQTMQAVYGAPGGLKKKSTFQRRLQEAKRAIPGAALRLDAARAEGRRRQTILQEACKAFRLKWHSDETTITISDGPNSRTINVLDDFVKSVVEFAGKRSPS